MTLMVANIMVAYFKDWILLLLSDRKYYAILFYDVACRFPHIYFSIVDACGISLSIDLLAVEKNRG